MRLIGLIGAFLAVSCASGDHNRFDPDAPNDEGYSRVGAILGVVSNGFNQAPPMTQRCFYRKTFNGTERICTVDP